MTAHKIIKAKVMECLDLAREKYGCTIKYEDVEVRFANAGQAAGQASCKLNRLTREAHSFKLKFSLEAYELDKDDFLNDTVPHEVAHLVTYNQPYLGKNHDYGWQSICIGLGGSGKRTHSDVLSKAKYKTQYLYRMPSGNEFKCSAVRHKKIQQRGVTYTFRNGEKMTADCFVRVISSSEHRAEHMTKVAAHAAKKGVDLPAAKKESATSHKRPERKRMSTGMSKLDLCRNEWLNAASHDRQVMIGKFVGIGCTPAGAATYYAKLKKEMV